MKNFLTSLFILIAVMYTGCSNEPNHLKNNGSKLYQKVLKAINGDQDSNKELDNLINLDLPVKNNYYSITVDSFYSANHKFYFTVIENPHPAYNRFAVYNNDLELVLIDKSLNGELTVGTSKIGENKFIRVIENFIVKDLINAKRLSLYNIDSLKINLVFRDFISILEPNSSLSQEIVSITKDTITTSLSIPDNIEVPEKNDYFIFKGNKYSSENNYFNELVIALIKSNNNIPVLPQIIDEKTLYNTIR